MNLLRRLEKLEKDCLLNARVLIGITSPGMEEIFLNNGQMITHDEVNNKHLLALYEVDFTEGKGLSTLFCYDKDRVCASDVANLMHRWIEKLNEGIEKEV